MANIWEKMCRHRYRDLVISLILFGCVFFLGKLTDILDNIYLFFLIMIFALALIIFSAGTFLKGAKTIAKKFGISEFVIGLTIVSIGTSVPEIASTSMASLHGHADLAIGNIFGSVLIQITFILGIVVLFCPIETDTTVIRRDGLCMLGAVMVLTIFTFPDKTLNTWEAIVLVILYVVYLASLFIYYRTKNNDNNTIMDVDDPEICKMKGRPSMRIAAGFFVIGLAFVVYSSNQIVISAERISVYMNMNESIIGTTITAFGTSIPELVVAIVAIKKARSLALGTLIGSNITDPLLSIGIAGIINPIIVVETMTVFNFLVPMTVVACVMSLIFMQTDMKIVKWEGGVLIFLYVLIIVGLFIGFDIFQVFAYFGA